MSHPTLHSFRLRGRAWLLVLAAAWVAWPVLSQAEPPVFVSSGAQVGHNSESGSPNNDVTSITATGGNCPAGVLGIVHLATDGVTTNHTAPAGWEQVDLYSGPSFTSVIWAHLFESGEGSPTFSWTEPESAVLVAECYVGVSTVDPIAAVQTASGSGTGPVAPSVTAKKADSLIVYYFSGDDDRRIITSFPLPVASAYTRISENDEGASIGKYSSGQPASGSAAPHSFSFHETSFGGGSPCCEEKSPVDPTDWRTVSVAISPSHATFEIKPKFLSSTSVGLDYALDCSDNDIHNFDQAGATDGAAPKTIDLRGFPPGVTCSVTATPQNKRRYSVTSAVDCEDVLIEDGGAYSCTVTVEGRRWR